MTVADLEEGPVDGRMKVRITGKDGETIQLAERRISTDLPADALGEILCEAINLAWRSGTDPVDMVIDVRFE